MKTTSHLAALALLLLAAAPALALQFNKIISPEEAKRLGVTITAHSNGEAGVRVVIEFPVKDELKKFLRTEVEIRVDGKSHFYGPVETYSPTPETRTASFSADESLLHGSVFSIVVLDNTATRIGYQFRVKDFIEVKK